MVNEVLWYLCELDLSYERKYVKVVWASDQTPLIWVPLEAEDGFEMKPFDLIDREDILEFVSFEKTFNVKHFEEGTVGPNTKEVTTVWKLACSDGLGVGCWC